MRFISTATAVAALAALQVDAIALERRNNTPGGPTVDLGDAGVYVGKLQNNGTVES
jgi:hypothetical protein